MDPPPAPPRLQQVRPSPPAPSLIRFDAVPVAQMDAVVNTFADLMDTVVAQFKGLAVSYVAQIRLDSAAPRAWTGYSLRVYQRKKIFCHVYHIENFCVSPVCLQKKLCIYMCMTNFFCITSN